MDKSYHLSRARKEDLKIKLSNTTDNQFVKNYFSRARKEFVKVQLSKDIVILNEQCSEAKQLVAKLQNLKKHRKDFLDHLVLLSAKKQKKLNKRGSFLDYTARKYYMDMYEIYDEICEVARHVKYIHKVVLNTHIMLNGFAPKQMQIEFRYVFTSVQPFFTFLYE